MGIVTRHDYLPFGEEIPPSVGSRSSVAGYRGADSTRQKFTQKERDSESGLDYFGARYYSSPQGRFTSSDPLLSSGTVYDPQTWNRYSYTLNNPVKYIDPFGLYVWDGSLGGTTSDDELKKSKEGRKILAKRNEFRNALAKIGSYATSKLLNEKQRSEIKRSVEAYGKEGDRGVTIATGKVREGAEAETTFGTESQSGKPKPLDYVNGQVIANVIVTFPGAISDTRVAHEGSHVADHIDLVLAWASNPALTEDEVNTLPQNLTKYATELRAYSVSSYLDQARNTPSELWNPGWTEVDRKTAIDRVLRTSNLYRVTEQNQGGHLLRFVK